MRIVIMGGTSGIGLATAESLYAEGHEVIVTGRDPERLAGVKDRVTSAEQVDGTKQAEVAGFFAGLGEVDHLVLAFSGGAEGFKALADLSIDTVRAAFEGKLLGYLHAIQQARVTGSITMVSAATARLAMPGTVVFAAVNGAVERVVSPLAAELAPVRVNVVSPGVVDTAWWHFLDDDARRTQFAEVTQGLPAGRVGRPEDVAAAIRYLIGATFVTGTILAVDGGATVA